MLPLQKFVEKWCHPDHQPEQVSEEDIAAVEAKFSIKFPTDYREQIIAVGAASPTLALLSAIDEQEVDLHDLTSLCTGSEIVEETTGWKEAGLPSDLVVIGGDSMGSKFCFKSSDLNSGVHSEAPIYFWDHDFGQTEKVASSFSNWINGYLSQWSEGLKYSDF